MRSGLGGGRACMALAQRSGLDSLKSITPNAARRACRKGRWSRIRAPCQGLVHTPAPWPGGVGPAGPGTGASGPARPRAGSAQRPVLEAGARTFPRAVELALQAPRKHRHPRAAFAQETITQRAEAHAAGVVERVGGAIADIHRILDLAEGERAWQALGQGKQRRVVALRRARILQQDA